jgi:hypothetical protein
MPVETVVSIADICKQKWEAWKHDCSGFASTVAAALGVHLITPANAMVDQLNAPGSSWIKLGNDGALATTYANRGYLVIGGLKAASHGHVVVVVPSSGQRYPVAYWGRFGGTGRQNTTVNWSWSHADLARVSYFARKLD